MTTPTLLVRTLLPAGLALTAAALVFVPAATPRPAPGSTDGVVPITAPAASCEAPAPAAPAQILAASFSAPDTAAPPSRPRHRPEDEGCRETPTPANLRHKVFHQFRYHQAFPATTADLVSNLGRQAELSKVEIAWIAARLPTRHFATEAAAFTTLFPAPPPAWPPPATSPPRPWSWPPADPRPEPATVVANPDAPVAPDPARRETDREATREAIEELRDLKDRYERKARALSNRPELAKSSGHARVRVVGSVACAIDGHGHTHPRGGGCIGDEASGDPTPAELLRASLAGSLALGYRVWGARLDVPIDDVEVELHTDDDARGQLLLETEVAPGWQRIHIAVTITSPAPTADVDQVFACANRHCLVLATLSPAIERALVLRVLPRPETRPPASDESK